MKPSRSIQTIIEQRPFTTFDDFLIRARPLYVEALNLVKAGALEGLGQPHELLEKIEQARWHGRHTAQLSLMSGDIAPPSRAVSIAERAAWEREVLGTLVSVHPLQLISADGQDPLIIQSHELSQHLDQAVTLAGVRLAGHRFRAPTQELMLLVDMEDRSGGYQVLWSGAVSRDDRALLNQREPVLIHGRVRRDRRGQIVVVGSQIVSL
jgi:DNA polymerase III alpha subunit